MLRSLCFYKEIAVLPYVLLTVELKKGHVVALQRWIDFGIYIDVLQKVSNSPQKQEILDLFSSVLYECVTQETPEMLPAYIAMDQVWFKNQFNSDDIYTVF